MVQVKVLMKISESPRKSLKSVKVLCVFDIMSAITHGSDGECKLTSVSEFEKLECDSSSIQAVPAIAHRAFRRERKCNA